MKITINPLGKEIETHGDKSLLQVLQAEGVYVKSSCGGHASCSDCILKIVEGKDYVNEPSFEETALLGNVFHITKERLACQCKIVGDVTIDISNHNEKLDQDRLRSKTASFSSKRKTKIRKKEEIEEIQKERETARKEKDEEWEKPWEKDKDPSKPKRLGGGKRPKRK